MDLVKRFLVPIIVLAFVVVAAVTIFGGDSTRTVVAHFPRAISVYEGSDVRVLGVGVGTVTGRAHRHRRHGHHGVRRLGDAAGRREGRHRGPVDRRRPLRAADPGLLRPGETLADGAELSVEQTSQPLELDQIYESLDSLNVALGPRGANKSARSPTCSRSRPTTSTGRAPSFRQTVKDFSRLSATLANNKEELFGCVEPLGNFIETLAENDQTVRQLQPVARRRVDLLDGERQELVASTENLSVALTEVSSFVQENKDSWAATSPASTGCPRCSSSSATRWTRSCTSRPAPSTTSR